MFRKVFRRSSRARGKSQQKQVLHRCLRVESLEQRAMLAAGIYPAEFLQAGRLHAANGFLGGGAGLLGSSVAISGATMVVGMPTATEDLFPGGVLTPVPALGGAYVFTESGSMWTQTTELIPTDGTSGDEYGASVAISGDTMVVGAPKAFGPNPTARGVAYVYTEVGGFWELSGEITASDSTAGTLFGSSVSVSGSTLVVGAPFAKPVSGNEQGAAYVFQYSAGSWTQVEELVASDAAAGDKFGASVSISNNTVVVGSPGHAAYGNAGQGAAYVFAEPSSGWGTVQPGSPFPATMTQDAELTQSDGAAGDAFGTAVVIYEGVVLAGAPDHTADGNADEGAVYIFAGPPYSEALGGTGWQNESETTGLTAPDKQPGEEFGSSVSFSLTGSPGPVFLAEGTGSVTFLVGAPDDTVNGNTGQGAAFVGLFGPHTTEAATLTEITSSDGAAGDHFGAAVAVSGDTVVVGAPNAAGGLVNSGGTAYAFETGAAIAVGTSKATGTYGKGTKIKIEVEFSAPVAVKGKPELLLNAGGGAVATYSSGSGTPYLTFTYTVGAGQASADLDYSSMAALVLHGGTIVDEQTGIAATLTLPAPGNAVDELASEDIVIDPPTPDPSTWATLPHATSSTSISMTATTASDPHGVEYYFRCLTPGGHNSGWQASPTYVATGLSPLTKYTFEVVTRDDLSHDTGSYSTSASATTT